ncbi:AzlC family ABC transporter permease [Helicobacter sp. MIT 14-3879]|uniref:AzlC family ABC transporter permease n=1 Tax=Helicobacter sp. MIT 14-3879 TaxID=2040649 RepID=UPI000E1E3C01|nr:AzlC family ABC transporter permease [Helicobacter sp. MIT 14-3879]RDU62085.1 branched-chain amino acid ABC transporter permease [Helicobacter sp. MIT 14-3879]
MIIYTLKDAFKKDIEILFGYVSMGACFGILLKTSGFSVIYALIMSVFVYSGVMQFLAISFFCSSFGLINIFFITLILNSRQAFYTLIMLDSYRKMDWKRFLNIFWLTDETFAIIKTKKPDSKSNKELFIFFIGLLNYIYWIIGCVFGALIGDLLNFNTEGLEFIMSAIFIVIFIDQLKSLSNKGIKSYIPALIGVTSAIFWLFLIGEKYFLLISIITSITLLALLRNKLQSIF